MSKPTKEAYRIGARIVLLDKMDDSDFEIEEKAKVQKVNGHGAWVTVRVWVRDEDCPKRSEGCYIDDAGYCWTHCYTHLRERVAEMGVK